MDAAVSPEVETIYDGLDTPHGMRLDVAADMVYWVDTGTNGVGGLGAQGVSRGRMDGSIPQEVLVNLGSEPWDIDIDRRCSSYSEWVARFFPRDLEGSAAVEADPDGDGLRNVAECGLGTHPLRRDSAEAAGEVFLYRDDESGQVYPAFRFLRRTGMTDLAVVPQHASGLEVWWDETLPLDGLPHLVELGVERLEEGLERVTVRSMFTVESLPGQQFRLRVLFSAS
ncbi:MAG TPA: hypothetical protein VMN36_08130 [Verrucomicrobiales bacterium]|nr:hypothetical protein [Verrucomicrobiales bacterium]